MCVYVCVCVFIRGARSPAYYILYTNVVGVLCCYANVLGATPVCVCVCMCVFVCVQLPSLPPL